MTDYKIPPDNTSPIVLHAGDRLDVDNHGTSHNVTVLDEAVEIVGKGGTSDLTTINEGGREEVYGAANLTTINNGRLDLFGATADHTKLNGYNSQFVLNEGSTATNTVIQNGSLFDDATSTIVNVTFQKSADKFVQDGVGVDNPQNLKGTISGLSVGDFLQFGGFHKESPNIDVTSFELKNNALTITYNNGQHATYQLSNMQAGTTFELYTGKDPWGDTFSRLTVVKAPAHEEVAHLHRAPELILSEPELTFGGEGARHHVVPEFIPPFVGFDPHHFEFGHHHLFG